MTSASHPRVQPPTLERALARQNRPLASISPNATVGEAVRQLAANPVAALAVVEDGRLQGVFSPRQLVHFLARGDDLQQPVTAAMAADVTSAAASDPVEDWLNRCDELDQLLPVIADGRLLGLLGRADLLAVSDTYHRRILQENDLDQRILFKRGTYSC